MNATTVNISFQKRLLSNIDKVARKESRSRSELLREAARMYIEVKERWEKIFSYGRDKAIRGKLSGKDISSEIRRYRQQKKRQS